MPRSEAHKQATRSVMRIAERLEASPDARKRKLGARVRANVLRCCTAPAAHWTRCLSAICVARRALFEGEGEVCDGCREWTARPHLLLVTVKLPHLPLLSDQPAALCDSCRQLSLSAVR